MTALTLQELIDTEKGPIWVRNRSSQVMAPGGDVFISVTISGVQRVVNVPSTWIPINLTTQVPRKALLDSTYFMEAVNKGLVEPISESDARKILSKDGAEEEVTRLAERARVIREAVQTRSIGRNVTVVNANRDEDEADAVSPQVEKLKKVSVVRLDDDDSDEPEAKVTVGAGFKAWVMKLNAMTPKEAAAAVRQRGSISYEEGLHFVAKLKHKAIAAKVSAKLNLADSNDD
jgi:hypothetical protein